MASRTAEKRRGNRIRVEDFQYVLRRDQKKSARIEELLRMEEVIRQAKSIVGLENPAEAKGALDPAGLGVAEEIEK